MTSYQNDILAQPKALKDTMEYFSGCHFPDGAGNPVNHKNWKRIILTGMGSSFYALLPLYRRLLLGGYASWLMETSELFQMPELIKPDTLIIAASQSGESAEIVHLLDLVDGKSPVIGISNTENSSLALRSTYPVLTHAGSEASVSCKTYLATLAAQCWLGDQLIAGVNELEKWKGLDALVEEYLAYWERKVSSLFPALEGIERIYLAGRGNSMTTTGTGGLILKESIHVPSEGMSSAAFRHGPFEMVGPQTFVMIFAGVKEVSGLNRKLGKDIVQAGGRCALVGQAEESYSVFSLPLCTESALPVLEILPVQLISLAFAEMNHFEAGKFTLASKVTTVE